MPTPHEQILRDAREELVRADNKAALLLAAACVGIGVVLAALLGRSWSPDSMSLAAQWIWWLGAASILAATGSLGVAVYPRTTLKNRAEQKRATYYGDFSRIGREGLQEALSKETGESYALDQIWILSQIALSKYRSIKISLWLLMVGPLLVLLAVAVNTRSGA